MSEERQRLLALLALDFWEYDYEYPESFFEKEDSELELEVHGRTMFVPTAEELTALGEPGRDGNWRTQQVLRVVLVWLGENIEKLDRYIDSSITFRDLRLPTEDEISELISTPPVKLFPPLPTPAVAWDVFDAEGWIDTVFYDMSTSREVAIRHNYNGSARFT